MTKRHKTPAQNDTKHGYVFDFIRFYVAQTKPLILLVKSESCVVLVLFLFFFGVRRGVCGNIIPRFSFAGSTLENENGILQHRFSPAARQKRCCRIPFLSLIFFAGGFLCRFLHKNTQTTQKRHNTNPLILIHYLESCVVCVENILKTKEKRYIKTGLAHKILMYVLYVPLGTPTQTTQNTVFAFQQIRG